MKKIIFLLFLPLLLLTSCMTPDQKVNHDYSSKVLIEQYNAGVEVASNVSVTIYKLGDETFTKEYSKSTIIQFPEYFEVVVKSDGEYTLDYYSNSVFGYIISKNIK